MTQAKIPTAELEVFKQLKGLRVIFDVGARTDVEYLRLKPKAQIHLFEPNPIFYDELRALIGGKKNVFINNYGLGDVEGEFQYSEDKQSFHDVRSNITLPIKTLDWYIQQNKIDKIDFLKIDTEGYDLKVLKGGKDAIKMARYIQFEEWDNLVSFVELLALDFHIQPIGYRNYLCIRYNDLKKNEGLLRYIADNNLGALR